MAARTLKLLHVEDDPLQRELLAHHLKGMKDLTFEVAVADTEDQAVDLFRQRGAEFVLLDYHLTQGNGLNCLRRLRQIDAIVPIVAVSGTATPEIAAELLASGADDYLSKEDLSSKVLVGSIESALVRADAMRRHLPEQESANLEQLRPPFQRLCEDFAKAAGADFVRRLEEFESAARQANLTPAHVERLFTRICTGMASIPSARSLLRPLLLEILLRISIPSRQDV